MNRDPRTVGGVAPRGEVTLTRAPLNIPEQPRLPDEGHRALASGSAIAAGSQDRFAEAPAPLERGDVSAPGGGFIGLLDAAGVPDSVVEGTRAWLEGGASKTSMERDATDLARAEQELQQAWGDQFHQHGEALADYVRRLPEDEREVFLHARDAEGRLYSNDPATLARLAGIARGPQPAAMTIPAIEAFMRSNRSAYNKDTALQARYRELLELREQSKGP